MPQLSPYLSFDGTCAEAMRFYERTLGGRLATVITYGQVPMGDRPCPPSHADRVMHASLVHPQFTLMAGDTPPGMPFSPMHGVMLSLVYPEADEARRAFAALAEGGTVTMPPGETFWAEMFGMLTDRYGAAWAVNGAMKPMPG